MIELTTTREIIEELGGTKGIASLTGANANAISVWRNSAFPWKIYPVITAALHARGKTAPMHLFGMKPKENAT